MPGPVLDALLAQTKWNDIESFGKKMEQKEAEHDKMRPEGSVTIEEMRRRAEKLEMEDFVGIPTSSEEVDAKKQETVGQPVPVDSGSNEIMKDFLNKLKG